MTFFEGRTLPVKKNPCKLEKLCRVVKDCKILMLHKFNCPLLLPITLYSPLLLSFFILCILNKKKKKYYKYIYVYKEGKFGYYTPLTSLFYYFAFRPPGGAGRYRGEAGIMLFVSNARLPEGVAGLTECGSVINHWLVGGIEFSGLPPLFNHAAGLLLSSG
jgi:hypothetical protein